MNSLGRWILLWLLGSVAPAFAEDLSPPFAQVLEPRQFSFPRDHGAHPEYQTEWWYFTGHLTSESQRTFGFELVFFRVGLSPRERLSRSSWATNSLYLTHFALTDDKQQRFVFFERRSRGSFGEAGAKLETLSCWNGPWKAEMAADGQIYLQAREQQNTLDLVLKPKKPIVLHGENGFSRKGSELGAASFYTSFSRLEGAGTISLQGEEFTISKASAWLDQEVTSSERAHGTLGWDWFAIQLDNGEELMLYQLRDQSGAPTEFSSGTWIRADGSSTTLKREDFELKVLEEWNSPRSGISYPARWTIRVPKLDYTLDIVPTVADQELTTEQSTRINYWEGRAVVRGVRRGDIVLGNAYVELVGYGKTNRAPR